MRVSIELAKTSGDCLTFHITMEDMALRTLHQHERK